MIPYRICNLPAVQKLASFTLSKRTYNGVIMAFKKRFKVHDETLNSYGFWISTAGMDTVQANRNCPAYFNHRTWEVPLGHWEDITKEANGEVYATLVIEGASDEERTYIRKIENGDIKGASVGVDPITWTEDALMLKPGQTRATLQASSLFEISLAPLPGNNNALALRKGNQVQLTTDSNVFIPTLNTTTMKAIALKLGLPETATEQQIIEKIAAVQLDAQHANALRSFVEKEAEKVLKDEKEKALFVQLSKTDVGAALSYLGLASDKTAAPAPQQPAAKPADQPVRVTDLIKPGVGVHRSAAADEGKDTFDYLQKHNPVELARIRKEDYEKYIQLAKDYQNGVRYKG